MLSLAFPEPSAGWLAWVAPALLLYVTTGVTARRGFALGFVFGLGFMGLLVLWFSIIGWVAWALAVVLEALFYGGAGAAWAVTRRRGGPAWRVVSAAAVWVAFEYLRSSIPLGGFTWGQLAQSQHDFGWMLRSAGLAGGWGVSFLLASVNALVVEAWGAWGRRRAGVAVAAVGAAALLVLAPLLLPRAQATGPALRVAMVQGNVSQLGVTAGSFEKDVEILRSHARLTRALAGEPVDLVVWPESSVGIDITKNEIATRLVAGAARAVDAPMIIGGNLDLGPEHYKVMAFQISPQGDIADRYQKTHLVPFGERVPARDLIGWLPQLDQVPRDAVAGDAPGLFEVAGGTVAPVLSFEGDFGSLVRARIGAGGRLLVVATNTSTWGYSWASAQHLAFSQVRAAENGVWTIHAAISGLSAFVAPDGEVTDSLPLWTKATASRTVRFAGAVTPYARMGDWLPIACLLATAVAGALALLGGHRLPGRGSRHAGRGSK